MTSIIRNFFTNLRSDAVLLTNTVHKETFIRSFSETFNNTVTIFNTFIIICIVHMLLFKVVTAKKDFLQLKSNQELHKAAYQFTNMTVNLILGIYGTYTLLNHPVSPNPLIFPMSETDFLERVTGYEDKVHFTSYQLGYNLWALPIGILKVNESPLMILHHISVLSSSFLACYTNIGCTMYATYIFGMAELSSVPLAIMNLLKDKREWTKKNFATGFAIVKVWFATSFLTLRVIVATPMIYDLTRTSFLLLSTMTFWKQTEFIDGSESFGLFKIGICSLDFILKICLGLLQYYWSTLVVAGLARMVPKGGGKKKKA